MIDDTLAASGSPTSPDQRERAGESAASSPLPEPGSLVGRYVVLSKLGAGAMGVVLGAYDPELDRRIALKLLEVRAGDREAAQLRLQREAQALAKLNHEHVVAVYDVGVHEGRVFVAMEFVVGRTLGKWMKSGPEGRPRPWREVVKMFGAAGRGLAAAHAEGLIHRDFKPDNVMIGADERVRVMDFGLARAADIEAGAETGHHGDAELEDDGEIERSATLDALGTELTHTGSMMGTPAYMAPEQTRGKVTARSDQFSYCVALYEALWGVRPFAGETLAELIYELTEGRAREPARDGRVPGWLRELVMRGLEREPDRRFADMRELLAVLATGEHRRRHRRRLLAAGAVVGIAAALFGARRWDHARRVAACVDAGEAIEEVWNPTARQTLRDGLLASEASYAASVADKIEPWIDAQALAWREHAQAACMHATVDESWDASRFDRANWCLEDRRVELETLVTELAAADQRVLLRAVQIASGLSPIEPCTNEAALLAMSDSPSPDVRAEIAGLRRELTRAEYLEAAAEYERGLELATNTRTRAEQLSWPPLTAEAWTQEASLLAQTGAYAESEAAASKGYLIAMRSSTWDTATDAANLLAHVVGNRLERHGEGKLWSQNAEAAITHAGDPLGLREAARLARLAEVHRAAGEYEQGLAVQEQALALQEQAVGDSHPLVAASLNQLANIHRTLGDNHKAKQLYERSLALHEQLLGPDHPALAINLNNLGAIYWYLEDDEAALACYQRALQIQTRALPDDHPTLANTLNNLGLFYWGTGDWDQAKTMLERALAISQANLGPEHPDLANTLGNLGLVYEAQEDYARARDHYEQAVAIRRATLGPDHPKLAGSLNNLASLHYLLGDWEEGRALDQQAAEIWEQALGPDHYQISTALIPLGLAHAHLGEWAEALAKLERAVELSTDADLAPTFLADAQFGLAKVLWDAPNSAGQDRARASKLAARAREAYVASGEVSAGRLGDVDAWLAAHEGAG